MSLPNLYIVGAPRCGTTAMYNYLNAHPEIAMASYKEPHFFGSDLVGLRFEIYKYPNDQHKYLKLFSSSNEFKVSGEASIFYLYSKKCAQEIFEFNPQAKILIMLRSPVEVINSFFYQSKLIGHIMYDTPEDLIADTDQIMQAEPKNSRLQFLTGDGVRYFDQVKRYLDIFGRNQVKIIIYDDFRDNIAQVYKETLQFLDVDTTFQPSSFEIVNPATKVRNPIIHRITSNKALIKFGMKVPLISIPIYRAMKILNSNKLERPPLSPEVTQHIKNMVRQDIENISELIKRDLTHWTNHD